MKEELHTLTAEAERVRADEKYALRTLTSMDLTSLGEDDTDDIIRDLCARAVTPRGHAAAVCIYDRFVPLARRELDGTGVRVATVCNFPHGGPDAAKAVAEARAQVAAGAQEVDVVLPYKRYKAGRRDQAIALLHQVREVCGREVLLKVILETSQLQSLKLIGEASRDAIEAGADFIKTSTGKVPGGVQLWTWPRSCCRNHPPRCSPPWTGGPSDSSRPAASRTVDRRGGLSPSGGPDHGPGLGHPGDLPLRGKRPPRRL